MGGQEEEGGGAPYIVVDHHIGHACCLFDPQVSSPRGISSESRYEHEFEQLEVIGESYRDAGQGFVGPWGICLLLSMEGCGMEVSR